jgi:hypothetical protein
MPTQVGVNAFSRSNEGVDGLPSQAMTVREQPASVGINLTLTPGTTEVSAGPMGQPQRPLA